MVVVDTVCVSSLDRISGGLSCFGVVAEFLGDAGLNYPPVGNLRLSKVDTGVIF